MPPIENSKKLEIELLVAKLPEADRKHIQKLLNHSEQGADIPDADWAEFLRLYVRRMEDTKLVLGIQDQTAKELQEGSFPSHLPFRTSEQQNSREETSLPRILPKRSELDT